jgi:UDP-N-acetylmuramyl pentapeptide phosphotransferase/UDP-N-acetylglucosamine-1-phosphate transferase
MEIQFSIFAAFILSLAMSLYEVPIIVRTVKKLKLMDQPNERSSAVEPIPTLGGIAIFLSFILSSSIGLTGFELPEMRIIIPATLIIFFVGLKDDITDLPPLKKFIAQVAVACMLIFLAKIRFTNLHGLFGIGEIGVIAGSLISCFTILVIINAFNLIDGIDGLAAGVTMLISAVYGSWFYISGHLNYAILCASLVGSVGGFFYFNVYGIKNKIFMGDTGSLVIGTVIAVLVIQFNEFNIDQTLPYAINAAPAISFGILSYPLIDMVRVTMIRIIHLKAPFRADKNHFHHRLLTLGLSHKHATYSIIGFNILFVIAVFYFRNSGILTILSFILTAVVILVLIPAYFIHKNRLIKNDDPVQQLLIPGSSEPPAVIRLLRSNFRREESPIEKTES